MTARDEIELRERTRRNMDLHGIPEGAELPPTIENLVRLAALVQEAVDTENYPCRLDHHGYCQDHPWGMRDEGCWIAEARRLLASTPILDTETTP